MDNRTPPRTVVPIPTPYYAKCGACSWRREAYSEDEGRYRACHHTMSRPSRCKVFLVKRWRQGEEIVDIIEQRAISRRR